MINKILRPILEVLPENNRLERIWVLAKTDFLNRYYGSILGVVWAMLNPLAQLLIYYYVFTIVFKNNTPHFELFLFLGLVLYMFYTETATKGLHVLGSKRYILENIQITWIDVYYAGTISSVFAFAFNFITYFLASLILGAQVHVHWLLLPALVVNLLIFGLATQIILSLIQIYIKDIVHLWDLAKMVLIWLSGVFYLIDPNSTWKSAVLAYLTPLPGIIINARNVLIYGSPIDGVLFVYDLIYAIVLYWIALILFNKLRYKALEKI